MVTKDDLIFHWRAEFTDGSVLRQFDENGEHSFKEVQDRESSLKYFYLELQNSADPVLIGVSLVDGSFNIGDMIIKSMKDDYDWVLYKPHFRVINFRRVRHHSTLMGDALHPNPIPDIDYFIGWQLVHEDKNYKKLLRIGSDGSFGMS